MAAACGPGDFGDFPGIGAALREFFACAGGLFGPAKRGVFAQAAGRRHAGPWDKMHGGRKGPGPWGFRSWACRPAAWPEGRPR